MVWFWLSSILYSFWCGWGNLGLGRLGKGGARTKVTGRIGFRSGQTVMVFWIPDSSPQENHGSNFQHISRSSVVPQATRSGTRGVRRTHLRFYQLPRNARKQMDCSALCSVSACIKKGGFRFRSCRVSQMILKSFNIIHFEPRRVKPRLLKVHRWCVRRTGLFPPLFPIPVKRNSKCGAAHPTSSIIMIYECTHLYSYSAMMDMSTSMLNFVAKYALTGDQTIPRSLVAREASLRSCTVLGLSFVDGKLSDLCFAISISGRRGTFFLQIARPPRLRATRVSIRTFLPFMFHWLARRDLRKQVKYLGHQFDI